MNAFVRAPWYWIAIGLLLLAWTRVASAVQEAGGEEEYAFKATYQVQKGTRIGRILIHVDMPERWHTYSLSQPSPPGATEIEVKESDDFKVSGEFAADREAKVTENDPIFGRLEEHYDEVYFVAPIEIEAGATLEKLDVDLKITCQICSEATCEFIKKRDLEVEFDGFYVPKPPEKKPQGPTDKSVKNLRK